MIPRSKFGNFQTLGAATIGMGSGTLQSASEKDVNHLTNSGVESMVVGNRAGVAMVVSSGTNVNNSSADGRFPCLRLCQVSLEALFSTKHMSLAVISLAVLIYSSLQPFVASVYQPIMWHLTTSTFPLQSFLGILAQAIDLKICRCEMSGY